ncbi:ribonuclease III [Pseudofulvibacter geojedonensis]|uniref:Ribonuclease 3 n=1 Tax=Pseudofulvibacter geojedonensis TaxID=1123758 RepID=A0ABW3I6Q7_9FLAO
MKRIIRKIFNSRPSYEDGNFFIKVSDIIGYKPQNISYFEEAFTHRSINAKDEKGNTVSYERLEFLGDAMLSAIIAEYLFNEVPHGNEGYLTKMRSKVVSREHLNELGKDLELLTILKSKMNKENFGDNIYGNVFEALVGAIFLDKGYAACEKFVYDSVIIPYIDIERLEGYIISYKSLLIEWCQKQKKNFKYQVYEDTGNDDTKHFAVKLRIDNKVIAKARATSKKKAEEKASKRAFFALQDKIKPKH